MVFQLWLSKILLMMSIARLTTCFRFFPEGTFLGAPITNDEIDKMLLSLEEDDLDVKGGVSLKNEDPSVREFYSQIASFRHGAVKKRSLPMECFESNESGNEVTYTAKDEERCKHSVDTLLEEKGDGTTLEDLTADYFNGNTYYVSSFKETGEKLSSISCIARSSVRLMKFVLGDTNNPSKLELELGEWEEGELSFKSVSFNITAVSKFKIGAVVLPYGIETKIEKPADSEDFGITKFDFTGQAVKWLELIGSAAEKLKLDNFDIVNKIGDTLKGFTGFGAFNKATDLQFGIVVEADIVKKITGARKITILYSKTNCSASPTFTIFIEFGKETQLIRGINNLLGITVADDSFMLNKISSETWCLLAVIGTTTYLDSIRTRIAECLGSEREILDTGVHFFVEFNFKEALLSCGNSESDVASVSTSVGIYASVNKAEGFRISLPNDVAVRLDMLLKCGGGSVKLPKFLSTATVALTDFELSTKAGLFTFGLEVTLIEKYSTIPGTSISFNKFTLLVERKQDEDTGEKYWELSATGVVKIGDANFTISLGTAEGQFFLRLSVDRFTLKDIFTAVDSLAKRKELQKEVYQKLGIKDFSIELTFGGGEGAELNIKGTPIIFGYEDLHFNMIIQLGSKSKGKRSIETENRPVIYENKMGVRRVKRASSGASFSLGIYMDSADFDSIVNHFSNKNSTQLNWLENLKAVVVISTTSGTVTNGDEEEEEARGKTKKSVARRSRKQRKQNKRSTDDDGNHENEGDEDEEGDEEEEEDDGLKLSFPKLGEDFIDTEFEPGLTFSVVYKIPTNDTQCYGNGICKFMVTYFNGSTITIAGGISLSRFELSAKLEGYVRLVKTEDSELSFTALELVIDVPSIKIEATLEYKDNFTTGWDNPIIFKGLIELNMLRFGINIEVSMQPADWFYPTPLTHCLAIGYAELGLGYTAGAPIPSFSLALKIKLGYLDKNTSNDHAIEMAGILNFDPGTPIHNYVHAKVSVFTVRSVCRAFKADCSHIPELILGTGFHKGIELSLSRAELDVDGYGTIPMGLHIKGGINFLGLSAWGEIEVSESVFLLHLELAPISWAWGLLKIKKSANEPSAGPYAYIKSSKEFGFRAEIEGYAEILHYIRVGVSIKIHSNYLFIQAYATVIPGLLYAMLTFEATYPDLSFKVGISLHGARKRSLNGPLTSRDEFEKQMQNFLKKFFAGVKRDIKGPVLELKRTKIRARKARQETRDKANRWRKSIRGWERKIRLRKNELEANVNKDEQCNCPEVCLPGSKWNPKCFKIFGKHDMGCWERNRCISKVVDVSCFERCALEKRISIKVRQRMQKIVQIEILLKDGAKGLFALADGVAAYGEAFWKAVKSAERFNPELRWAYKQSKRLVKRPGKFKLISLYLSADLTANYSECMNYNMSLVYKVPYSAQGVACLDRESFKRALILGITEGPNVPSEFKSKRGNSLGQIQTEAITNMDTLRKAEKVLKDLLIRVDDKVSEETRKLFQDERRFNRPYSQPSLEKVERALASLAIPQTVPSKEEMEIHRLAHEPIPNYDITEDPELRSFDTMAPWSVVDIHRQPLGYNSTITPTGMREKRGLHFDDSLSPCDRLKTVLVGYSQLTDGLVTQTESFGKGIADIMLERNANGDKLRNARNNIEAAVRDYNMTNAQRENAYFLYRKIAKGYDELDKKSHILIKRDNMYALPVFHRQLNTLLNKEVGSTFLKFTDRMHENAVRGYKRSIVPTPTDGKGEELLASIKQKLQSIVTDEDSELTSMLGRINAVKKDMVAMKPYTKQCEG